MTDEQQQQIGLYGKLLTSEETALNLAQLARIHYLKQKMRPRLAAIIGDTPDNITDVLRAVILSDAIRLGLVTDEDIIKGYQVFVQAMLNGYGGESAILSTLAGNIDGLQKELVEGYYKAKQAILASVDIDEVNWVDLPGEPKIERM